MSLGDGWMSCRPTPAYRGIALLPQFDPPATPVDFSIEHKPPTLPSRNSPARVVCIAAVAVFCFVGSCAVVSAAVDPVLRNGARLVNGVQRVVGSAISHANEQAELDAIAHYNARRDYLERRGARRVDTPPPVPKRRLSSGSNLLTRMAALKALENSVGGIDDASVFEHFPSWGDGHTRWDEDAVLHDVVLAVSHLAVSHLARQDMASTET